MKRTLCLLLGLSVSNAWAAPAASWIEYNYSELENQQATARETDGNAHGLSMAYATSPVGYYRADIYRETETLDTPTLETLAGPTPLAPDATTDLPPEIEHRREIHTVSAGLRSPMNSGVDLIGEIGVARIRLDVPVFNAYIENGAITHIGSSEFEIEETGGVGRLGLVVEDGSVAWGATMEWFNKMPDASGETDSVRWMNAYLGYRITPAWTISLRYSDTEQYKSKGINIRWTL